ncbi:hypothetical protein ES288_D09G063500v1 [Gossypium darwinii]|uniref:Uncharacterized protein n=1 Tax=Gossypium darwinii TaxID=34276 RepID=A0A5D2B8L3_GOSDA|nr:hypothetical protein ES288_D09G063500v1 [Gossypium darwinii]
MVFDPDLLSDDDGEGPYLIARYLPSLSQAFFGSYICIRQRTRKIESKNKNKNKIENPH